MKKVTVTQKLYYSAAQARKYGLGYFPVNAEGSVEVTLSDVPEGGKPVISVEGIPESQTYGVVCLVHRKMAASGKNVKVVFNPVSLPKNASMYSDALGEALIACQPR